MFVVIGQTEGKAAEAAIGPFPKEAEATEFRDLLASVTSGQWTVLPCHTPVAKKKST